MRWGVSLLGFLGVVGVCSGQREASMRAAEEIAPAGGLAVIQIELTEPVPILTGDVTVGKRGAVLGDLCGLGLLSSALDVVGVGTRQGDQTRVRFLGFSGQVGLSEDLPVMVVAFDVSPTAGLGAQGSLEIIESSLRLEAPGGAVYLNDVKQGTVTVGGASITQVTPSNGIVPAGAQIRFRGVGFGPDSRIDVDGVELTSVRVVNSGEIVAVAGQSFRIDNRRIRLRTNDAEFEDFFYTFTPAKLAPASANPLLRSAIPIHSPATRTVGTIAATDDLVGLSVRNLNGASTTVQVRAFDQAGRQLADASTSLGAGLQSTLTPSEWLGGADVSTATTFSVESDQPVQTLGLRFEDNSFAPGVFSDAPPPVPEPTPRPAISAGGWVQASLVPTQRTLAPLAITTLFGSDFAPPGFSTEATTQDLQGGRLPTRLGGVCVEIDGVRAPLFFVSSGQINLQALDGSAGAASAIVIRGCGTAEESRSASETTVVAAASPTWFVFGNDPSGENSVAALHGGGPLVAADPMLVPGGTPAVPGETVSLFATGLGITDPPLAPGVVPGSVLGAQLARVTGAAVLTIAGRRLPLEAVLFVGAAPCCAGLYQVVLQLPADLPTGRAPVSIAIDGVASPSGPFLAIQRP